MTRILMAVLLACSAMPARTAYFDTIFRDPAHPKVSAALLYTPRYFNFDGGVTDVAAVYHRGDPADTIWPKALLDAGIPPVSWTLLEVGAGGNRQTGFAHFGTSVNVAPTVLGPIVHALTNAGGNYAVVGKLLVAPNGSGVKLSLGWKADVIENGEVVRFNKLRFPPRYGVGYSYQFGE